MLSCPQHIDLQSTVHDYRIDQLLARRRARDALRRRRTAQPTARAVGGHHFDICHMLEPRPMEEPLAIRIGHAEGHAPIRAERLRSDSQTGVRCGGKMDGRGVAGALGNVAVQRDGRV